MKLIPNLSLATALLLSIFSATFSATSSRAFEVLPEAPPVPADNPQSPEKVELGRKLYFETRISQDGTISCNTCHDVMKGGDDNLPFSVGHKKQKGGRSAPTVWNSAYQSVQFWDGRAESLEEQAKGPMINPVEMGNASHDVIISRLRGVPAYEQAFRKVFPPADPKDNPLTIQTVSYAIAAYERTLITPNAPMDRYLKGDKKALSESAKRGMDLVTTVGCTSCHSGPMYQGPTMPKGQGFYMKFPTFPGSEYDAKYKLTEDTGRHSVTKLDADKHTWRVATWRNVALTAPYFHNGSVAKLDEAVRVMAKTQLNKTLAENEVKDIVEFLKALTGVRPKQTRPKLP